MADYHIRKGDLQPPLESELYEDGVASDLTGASSVELRLKPKAGGAEIVKTAEFVSMKPGRVRYNWQSGDTDISGVYAAYWRVYFGSRAVTFPNRGSFTIAITETH